MIMQLQPDSQFSFSSAGASSLSRTPSYASRSWRQKNTGGYIYLLSQD